MHGYFLLALCVASALSTKKEDIFKQAVGPCIDDRCQSGYSCYYGQCVPKKIAPNMPAMRPELAVGPCIDNMCPPKTFCHKKECFPE